MNDEMPAIGKIKPIDGKRIVEHLKGEKVMKTKFIALLLAPATARIFRVV